MWAVAALDCTYGRSGQWVARRVDEGGGGCTDGVVGSLLLGSIDDRAAHGAHHQDHARLLRLNPKLPNLTSKNKRAIDIHIEHLLPVIKRVIFRRRASCDAGVGHEDVDLVVEVVENLSEGLPNAGFVGGIAFVGVEFGGWEAVGLDFGVDGFDGLAGAGEVEVYDCAVGTGAGEGGEDLVTEALGCAGLC